MEGKGKQGSKIEKNTEPIEGTPKQKVQRDSERNEGQTKGREKSKKGKAAKRNSLSFTYTEGLLWGRHCTNCFTCSV